MAFEFIEPGQHRIEFGCPKCGQGGAAVWERHGPATALVGISRGFSERLNKEPHFAIEIVCDTCGAIVGPAASPPFRAEENRTA